MFIICIAHYMFVYVDTLLFSFGLLCCYMIVFTFLGLISVLVYTAMPLSPVSTCVHASFAKFTCSRFCFVLLCIWCLQINWIGFKTLLTAEILLYPRGIMSVVH